MGALIQAAGSGGISIADAINLVGIALLLAYGYFHFQYENAADPETEQEAQNKAVAVFMGFVFYAAVVAASPVSGTWVGAIGIAVNEYFEQFAQELVFTESPVREPGALGGIVSGLKTLGLVAYVLVTGLVSISLSIPVKVAKSIF
jgi:hypothetical protein